MYKSLKRHPYSIVFNIYILIVNVYKSYWRDKREKWSITSFIRFIRKRVEVLLIS